MLTRSLLTLGLLLTLTGVAFAQKPPEPGNYDMDWSKLQLGQKVELTFGTRAVEVVQNNGAEPCPPTSTIVLKDPVEGVWCFLPNGSIDGSSGASGEGDVYSPNASGGFDGFYFRAKRAQAQAPEFTGVGFRQAAAPPPPPPSTLKVTMTAPHNGDTVSGTNWVVLWVDGASGSSNTFSLSVDGKAVGTPQTTSSRGPVTLPWSTTGFPNGTHTLTGSVRDAAGNAGSTSISVIVKN
jgi:hypothetical protein